MSDYSIQHASEIIDGADYIIHANHLIDNFNGLNSAILDRVSSVTANPQSIASALIFNGTITVNGGFSANPILPNDPTTNLQIATKQYVDNNAGSGFVTRNTANPASINETTFKVARISERNASGYVTKLTNTVVDITINGLNGLDTGSVAANTFYYLYAIDKADHSAPGLILSIQNEFVTGGVTMPSGYATGIKIQLPFALRTGASAEIIPFFVCTGGAVLLIADYSVTTSPLCIASSITSTSATWITAIMPGISTLGMFQARHITGAGGGTGYISQPGTSAINNVIFGNGQTVGAKDYWNGLMGIGVVGGSHPGKLEVKVAGSSDSMSIWQTGYYPNLILES